ncbi:hypothetical protein ACQJBY_049808 [Aegilops geniculata]
MGSKAAPPPLAEHHSSPVMAASATTDGPSFPIYISSDEEEDVAVLGSSSSPEEIQIQQAILLSIGLSRDPTGIPSSSASLSGTDVDMTDRKGKRKLRSESPHQVIDIDDNDRHEVIDVDDDDSLIFIKETGSGKWRKPRNGGLLEVGEGSHSATIMKEFYCTICMETLPGVERFPVAGCAHAFCAGCVRQYIAARVEENLLSMGCPDPGCKGGVLHPEECRDIVPPQLFQRWGAALCEVALGDLKFYCPFKDCSALLIDDDPRPGDGGAAALTNVECPHCNRMFCAQCKVPWHEGVDCAEFQRLGKDERGREDLLLRKVAQKRKWQRCPRCKMYVERVAGCEHMSCRCGHSFCYLCGGSMMSGGHHCYGRRTAY